MGNSQSIKKINFEDVQQIVKNPENYIVINTLPVTEQDCLLPNTISIHKEEETVNRYIVSGNREIKFVIYGRNCNDDRLYTKYMQLNSHGFYNVFVYTGGLFEWLLLQDIYGAEMFPTTKKENDLLRFKPCNLFL